MKLRKETYTVSRAVLEQVLEALEDNQFSSHGEEDYNNDDIMDAHKALESELEEQDSSCHKCQTRRATRDHTCPFKVNIHNDSETLCDCCDECVNECRNRI